MAWETTNLLSIILLEILASGCWAQRTELLRALEGQTVSVQCSYEATQHRRVKIWCLQTSSQYCIILTDSLSARGSRFSIQDYPEHKYFVVTMKALTQMDEGFYHCGVSQDRSGIIILKTVRVVVAKAPTPPTTRSARMTTAGDSATNLANDSSSDQWTWKVIITAVTLAVLLLLGLIMLVALYLRKARGRAGKGLNESHHIYEDLSGQKEETTGFHQKNLSDEDTGTIHYASLIHLDRLNPQDSIYTNTQPDPKPTPDPLLSVEYARISTNKLQSSQVGSP